MKFRAALLYFSHFYCKWAYKILIFSIHAKGTEKYQNFVYYVWTITQKNSHYNLFSFTTQRQVTNYTRATTNVLKKAWDIPSHVEEWYQTLCHSHSWGKKDNLGKVHELKLWSYVTAHKVVQLKFTLRNCKTWVRGQYKVQVNAFLWVDFERQQM